MAITTYTYTDIEVPDPIDTALLTQEIRVLHSGAIIFLDQTHDQYSGSTIDITLYVFIDDIITKPSVDTIVAAHGPPTSDEENVNEEEVDQLDELLPDTDTITNIETELDDKASNIHTHVEADITDLQNYSLVGHTHDGSDIVSGTIPNARISSSSVTQHEGDLTIAESQISDLGDYAEIDDGDENTTETWSSSKIASEIAASGGSSGRIISFCFASDDDDYIKWSSDYWGCEGAFEFPGSSQVGSPTKITAVARQSSSSNTGWLKIYDITNNKIICQGSFSETNDPQIVNLGTLSNIPTTPAIWEIHIKDEDGEDDDDDTVYLWGLTIHF